MTIHFSYLLAAISSLLLAGCESVIDIDPPAYDPELIVTSHFAPDSLWSTFIHTTVGAATSVNPRLQVVDDAVVRILHAGGIVDELVYDGRGRYVSGSDTYPEAGRSYRLSVETPEWPSVSAESAAPVPAPIIETDFFLLGKLGGIPGFGQYEFRLQFRIKDAPGTNFYRFAIYRYGYNSDVLQWPEYSHPDSTYEIISMQAGEVSWFCGYDFADSATPVERDAGTFCNEGIVTDRLFDGQIYQFTATIALWSAPGDDNHEILLLLSTLSEDYFEYQRTVQTQTNWHPAFSIPQNIYSNVDGALGVFAGYSNTTRFLPIPFDE